MPTLPKYLPAIAFVVLVLNVVGLWIFSSLQFRKIDRLISEQTYLEQTISILKSLNQSSEIIFPSSPSTSSAKPLVAQPTQIPVNTSAIEQEVGALEKRVEIVEKTTLDLASAVADAVATTSSSQSSSSSSSSSTSSEVKEYNVFIGSGSSSSLQWTNIDSAVITLNADNYPNIKEVRFEAALSIVGGNAYARLVNQANGAVIYNSEQSHNTSTTTWKTSNPITLQSGMQTYIVQLRSSSSEKVNMSGARLRIITE